MWTTNTNENIRSEDESPTDDLMLDDGLEEEDEQVDEQVEQEIPENAEAVPDVPEDTTDLLGAGINSDLNLSLHVFTLWQ